LKYLVEEGASVNEKNNSGETPLHFAAQSNSNVDVLKYLVAKGADVNAKNGEGATLLHFAAQCNSNIDVLEYLIEKGANVNAKNKDGETPLHFAAQCNSNVDVLKYLVENGADVNAKNDLGWTPLHFAAYNFDDDVLKYLIENGADINAKDVCDTTPLHFAAQYNSNVDVLKYLIENGADINAKDYEGKTPLDVADTEEKKQILINAGATTVYHPSVGPQITPKINIFKAVKRNDLTTVKQLLQINPYLVHDKNKYGKTPLHYAARYNSNVDVLKYLIEKGADINAKDYNGKTPLDVANTKEKKQILRHAGAETGITYPVNSGCGCLILVIFIEVIVYFVLTFF
jgi:ankyrin repeat protein